MNLINVNVKHQLLRIHHKKGRGYLLMLPSEELTRTLRECILVRSVKSLLPYSPVHVVRDASPVWTFFLNVGNVMPSSDIKRDLKCSVPRS